MGENSKIQWCDHTFNPWIGCTKVSPGCANCYAETLMDTRYGRVKWGKGQPRSRTSESNWKLPLRWNKKAEFFTECAKCGARRIFQEGKNINCFCADFSEKQPPLLKARPRVFCGSLCDWLDDEVPIEWLTDLLDLIRCTPNIDWLLLTKRSENWFPRIRKACNRSNSNTQFMRDWLGGRPPANVWIGTTSENQEMYNQRVAELKKIPARVHFLSLEPLLSAVDLNLEHIEHSPDCDNEFCSLAGGPEDCDGVVTGNRIDWVICGGESGPGARPMHPDWARSLRDQCQEAGVPFFFKQWGEWAPGKIEDGPVWVGEHGEFKDSPMHHVGKKAAGRLLDGREWSEMPEAQP